MFIVRVNLCCAQNLAVARSKEGEKMAYPPYPPFHNGRCCRLGCIAMGCVVRVEEVDAWRLTWVRLGRYADGA